MESQMTRPHHHHQQEPDIVGGGHHQTGVEGYLLSGTEGYVDDQHHHHEKKSVLKKVKAKAKKIKETITGHGHNNHDHDLDEEDDDDEEMIEDPEIHGAPMYDSAAIRSGAAAPPEQVGNFHHGRSTAATEIDPVARKVKPESHVRWDEESMDRQQARVKLGLTTGVGEVPQAPQNTPLSRSAPDDHIDPSRTFLHGQGQRNVNLQRPEGLEEDSAAPKHIPGAYTPSNYESKVTDPTGRGGQEVGVAPFVHSFDKMNIYDDQPKPKLREEQNWPPSGAEEEVLTSVPTGSHDQFSPELAPPRRYTATPETYDSTTKPQDYSHDNEGGEHQEMQGGESTMKPTIGSTVGDKATSAKNVVASKLGYGEKDDLGENEMQGGETNTKPASATATAADYGKKIATTVTQKLSPVYEKIAGAGSTMMSKARTGTGNEQGSGAGVQDKGVSVKDYFAEKLRPGEEDKALSEVISQALYKPKAETERGTSTRSEGEVVSDPSYKEKEESDEASRPIGKVTESIEVRKRLGPTESDTTPGKGVVDKIKDAVSSWYGKAGETVTQQSFVDHNSNISEERRLQESGN